MSIKDLINKNKQSFSLISIAAILPFIVSSVILTFIIQYQNEIKDFNLSELLLFYLAASFCMALAFTHTTLIAILSGFFFGWYSAAFVIFSYLFASIIGYFLAKKIDRGNLMDTLIKMPKAKIIAEELKNNELKIIILSRISPILPFAMMNMVLSILKADFKKYLLGGFAGMLPRTLVFIWTGSQARDLMEAYKKGANNDFISISVLLFLVLSIVGLTFYIFKATQKAKKLS